jgi:FkbM family methyltransferase
MTARQNWADGLDSRIDFELRARERPRKDHDFEWSWCEGKTRTLLGRARHVVGTAARAAGLLPAGQYSRDWYRRHGDLLWEARCLLDDDVSKLLFDAVIVLRACGHRRSYFPRLECDDLLTVRTEAALVHEDLSGEYLGLPLRVVDVGVSGRADVPVLTMIITRLQLDLVNKYRQYLVRRSGYDLAPARGEVVVDCGACIGEFSLLFSGLVGTSGQVHLFDPVPLHARYCKLQEKNNAALAGVMRINSLAVGRETRAAQGGAADVRAISPGSLQIESFSTTTLDDYAKANLSRVDFIKMDIEGAEMDALRGASASIREFKPRLAICAYHKFDDLWMIPRLIKELNPDYRLSFGHHSPTVWESVYYAVDPRR